MEDDLGHICNTADDWECFTITVQIIPSSRYQLYYRLLEVQFLPKEQGYLKLCDKMFLTPRNKGSCFNAYHL